MQDLDFKINKPKLERSGYTPRLLLIDTELTKEQKILINEHFSTYTVSNNDYDLWLENLPKVDLYIIQIGQKVFTRNTRSHGLLFYELNKPFFPNNIIVYYYRTRLFLSDSDVNSLESDYLIRTFPQRANDKEDLIMRMSHTALPKVDNCCSICCQCLIGKYTCCDFYRSLASLLWTL